MRSTSPASPVLCLLATGFSLMELMGVLAVLTLLIGLAADGAIARRKRTNRQAEVAELSRLSEAYIQSVLRTRSLPAATNWMDWLAADCSLPVQRIARNGAGGARQLIYDPGARFGRPLAPYPFVQVPSGSLEPERPRLLWVSSLADDLPDLRSVSFESLWTNAPDVRPVGWPATWNGEPGDLLIERLDLRSRFHRILLHNVDSDTNASYALALGAATVPANGRVEGWFLNGSLLELRSVDGSTQAAERITEDCSYVYERRRWQRQIVDGPVRSGGLGAAADSFLSAPFPSGAGRSAIDSAVVVDEVVQFLNAYANWGAQGFPAGAGIGAAAHPLWRSLSEAQARLRDFSYRLILP